MVSFYHQLLRDHGVHQQQSFKMFQLRNHLLNNKTINRTSKRRRLPRGDQWKSADASGNWRG